MRIPIVLALLFAASAASAETHFKDRLLIEKFPREVEEGASITFKLTPQGKYKWGWCAVTYPDGTVGDYMDAAVKGGKAEQKVTFDKGKGRYVVEFLVESDLGPAVGGIFSIFAGVPWEKDPEIDFRWDARPDGEQEQDVFRRINEFRRGRKLPELAWDEKMAAIGRDHCDDMIENRYFAHVSPTAGNLAARARVKYGWKKVVWGMPDRLYLVKEGGPVFVGEDIAFDNNPAAAFESWLASPGHRQVFLNKFVTHLGVAARKSERQENGVLVRRIYFVAAFALYADADIEKAEKEAARRAADARAQPSFERAEDMEARDLPEAVRMYEEVAAKHPGTTFAEKASARAKELTSREDWDEVVRIATARREARGWVERARMLIDNKKPENAREWIEKVLQKHPKTPEADEARRLLETLPE